MPRRRNSGSRAALATSAAVFAALGDQTRLGIVSRLCDAGPMSIARLTDGFGVTRQAIAKHLRVMEEAGIVRGTYHGRESVWQVEAVSLEQARRYLEAISTQWDRALGRLKKFVER